MRFHRGRTRRAVGSSMNGVHPDPGSAVAKNVEDIVRIESGDRARMGLSDHVADAITAFGGSMLYVWLHVAWFATWILVNAGLFGLAAFDEFPFGLLTMIVSLEAIFLSTFVLISQNRAAVQADRRAHLDLQLNMLAEQEVTRLMRMVADLHEHFGLGAGDEDAETAEMMEPVKVDELAKAVESAEDGG